ncbi:MAG: hypothetical protein KBD46_03220 [Candidatus Levybacteria bacterium]|nr:hypothetical protein [Candidatus Levybacteria bacterium]
MLADLITSKSRVTLLTVFLSNPQEMYHVRELVRRTDDEINAVRRELSYLEKNGILDREPRANRVYYSLSKDYPYYFDLLNVGVKIIGLGVDIVKNRNKLGKIKFAMFSGRFARRLPKQTESVDLLLVGTVVLPELALIIKNEEKRIGNEINYTIMSEEEFAFRKKRTDPFIISILSGSRVMLIGDEENLLA